MIDVLWYGDLFDRTNTNKSKPEHIISNSHKHNEKQSFVVKDYEVIRPDISKIDHLNNNSARDC